MPHTLYAQASLFALVFCCGLAVWKGDLATRAGAILIISTWLITVVAFSFTRAHFPRGIIPVNAFLASDAILAVGLLLLALRFSNWWMGAAMILQAIGLALNAVYFSIDKSELDLKVLDSLVLGKNLASAAMLLVILAATVANVLRRRGRSEPLSAPQPA